MTETNTSAAIAQIVTISHGVPTTSSLILAEKFGKYHRNVLRAISNLECSDEFRLLNFEQSSYLNDQGRTQPCCEITKDGFAFLAMGFTGKAAATWKERFISAFNWQAKEINRLRAMQADPRWQSVRIEGKSARRHESDVIKAFVEYAKAQGSRNPGMYYMTISKETSRALFFVNKAVGKDFRNKLTAAQLASVAMAERIVERALLEAMAGKKYYKDAYRVAADRLRQFADFVGQSVPGHSPALLEAA